MKHAILIATHNNEEITKQFLSLYDDENIDFYIHVDKKAKYFKHELFYDICKKSHIYFTKRINVYWGTYSQIKCELLLLKSSICRNYDYYHLISGCDIPLLTKNDFLNVFEENKGKEFVEFSPHRIAIENDVVSRVKYYYVLQNSIRNSNPLIRKPQTFIRESLLSIQKKLNVNRCKNIQFSYGSNWFDITHHFAKYVLEHESWIHKHFHSTCCADELFLQTLLEQSKFVENNYYNEEPIKRRIQLGRFVDWQRGNPYTFRENDFNDIIKINTSFFIRKFNYYTDSVIVDKLFDRLREREK